MQLETSIAPAAAPPADAAERARLRRLLQELGPDRPAIQQAVPAAHAPSESPARRRHWLLLATAVLGAAAGGAGVVAFRPSPAAVPAAEIAAAPPAAPASALQASGFVVATRQATVSADVTGRLAEISVFEGSTVRQGQVLARLDPRTQAADVAFASAQVAAADRASDVTEARLNAAATVLARRESLAAKGFVSLASLDEARDSKRTIEAQLRADREGVEVARRQMGRYQQQLRSVAIVAPFDGVVTALSANVGEIVSPISAGGGFTRTGICTIVDLRSLEGEVDVSEQYLSRVREGSPIKVRLPAYPGVSVTGRVSAVTAAVNRSTAAVKVRVKFDQIPKEMLPGMRIDISFEG